MTSLKKQLDDVVMKLIVIRDKLEGCHEYPPCCLTFDKNNRISCDTLGPMCEKEFLLYCKECRERMEEQLAHVRLYPQ